MDKQEIVDMLKESVEVTFTKKDGTTRVMWCTQDKQKIPLHKWPQGTKKESEHIVTVFDLEKNDWRSFDVDSVVSTKMKEWKRP